VKTRTTIELPGFVTVAAAAERLKLASRSVRDLIYAGRIPSARLGRRHFLRVPDVESERRRRLGLPLPAQRTSARRSSGPRPSAHRVTCAIRAPKAAVSAARRERAEERATQLERWLRAHAPSAPALPFETVTLSAAAACDACHRPVRAGGRMLEARTSGATRLCLTCGRRTLLIWSDARRREAVAARRLAGDLGTTYTPLLEPATAA
jgi:excisionase family DNA binding protein